VAEEVEKVEEVEEEDEHFQRKLPLALQIGNRCR
jgi:hypothetical protein